jgi:alpha-tubulin suppressor-like RCC1 family protein
MIRKTNVKNLGSKPKAAALIDAMPGVLDASSYAFCWGEQGSSGILGNNNAVDQSSPVSVVGDRKFIFVATGYRPGVQSSTYIGALDESSYAWFWGYGNQGQFGDNNPAQKSSPVSTVGGRQWAKIIPSVDGNQTTIFLDGSGYAWATGYNGYGKCGDNSITNRSSPVSVLGGKRWIFVASSGYGAVALDDSSYAWSWGNGAGGLLGNNSITSQSSPVSVLGDKQWKKIFHGSDAVYGIDSSGYMWSWGAGTNGALGHNATTSASSPVSVVGGKIWIDVVCTRRSSALTVIALDDSSYAWSWGYNTNGELGVNATTARSSPTSVVGGRQWKKIIAKEASILGIDSNNYAWGWGLGTSGQLGTGPFNVNTKYSSPVSVVGGKQWADLTFPMGTGTFAFGLDTSGYTWAWGDNSAGQIGDSTKITRSTPVLVNLREFPRKIFGDRVS